MPTQLYSALFECRAYKVRTFDIDTRLQPSIVELITMLIECQTPTVELYDNVVYYVRSLDEIANPFDTTKDDTVSFFTVNEQKNDIIESTYISTNLKVITPFSELLNRPLSRFDSVKATSGIAVSRSGTDDYVALNFEEIEDFNNLEIVRDGMACVICGTHSNITPTHEYDMFEYMANAADLKFVGIIPNIMLTQNYYTTPYCSFYYGILDIPSDIVTYYFSFTASSIGYLFIDGAVFLAQETKDSVTPVTGSILLSKGHHTFTIKHYAYATSTNDTVRLQFKAAAGDAYVDFNVDNLSAKEIELSVFPIYTHTVLENVDTFIANIDDIVETSLDSLYIKKFRPLIVLTRKYSALLQKEFDKIYYQRIPDTATSSLLVSGMLSTLYAPYDFPFAGSNRGVTLNCDRNSVLSPYITYTYNTPVKVSQFEIMDTPIHGASTSDFKQCWSFTFSIVNELKERIPYSLLYELIDFNASKNVEMLQTVTNSDTYARVIKKNTVHNTIVVFKDYVQVREITLRDPSIPGSEWGSITSFKVHLKATEIVKLIDRKGELSIIQDIDNENVVAIDYDGLGHIPTIFNHKNVAPDIQYGSDFIMFCLDVLGEIDDIVTLGNMYDVCNYDDHTVFNSDHLLNVRQLDQSDDRKFTVNTDVAKTGTYDFAYVGYNTSQGLVQQTDFQSIVVQVTNTGASILTDKLYSIKIPNIGIGYTCVNENMTSIPVAGVRSNNTLTSDSIVWDTDFVQVKIPSILVGSTAVLSFTQGTFSNTALLTGTATTAFTYLADIQQLPLIAVRIPLMVPGLKNIALMTSNALAAPSTSIIFDVPPALTLALLLVNEITGNDRANVELTIDISDIIFTFSNCMFRVYDATTRTALDTVGINNDNSVTSDFAKWDGYRIRFRIPVLKGGISSHYLVRIGVFYGDPTLFTPTVQLDLRHNYHFSGGLVDSVTGTIGIGNNVSYNVDKTFEYYRSLELMNEGYALDAYAKLTATTAATNFSVSFWFTTVLPDRGILCFSNTAALPAVANDLKFSINADGHLVFSTTSGATSTLVVNDKSYVDGQWHHVVLTSHSTLGMTLYTDAVQRATNTILSKTVTTAYVYLGWNTTYFTGSLDEFRVYNKCLTANEVITLNLLFDGTVTATEQQYERTSIVRSPVSRITNLVDTSTLLGTPMYIYKYVDIDETIVRYI